MNVEDHVTSAVQFWSVGVGSAIVKEVRGILDRFWLPEWVWMDSFFKLCILVLSLVQAVHKNFPVTCSMCFFWEGFIGGDGLIFVICVFVQ